MPGTVLHELLTKGETKKANEQFQQVLTTYKKLTGEFAKASVQSPETIEGVKS